MASSSASDSSCFVAGQLDHRHVEGGQHRGRVEVAAFLRLSEQTGPAASELGQLAPLDECPEDEVVEGIAFPGDARAMIAEELVGLVERQSGRTSTLRA